MYGVKYNTQSTLSDPHSHSLHLISSILSSTPPSIGIELFPKPNSCTPCQKKYHQFPHVTSLNTTKYHPVCTPKSANVRPAATSWPAPPPLHWRLGRGRRQLPPREMCIIGEQYKKKEKVGLSVTPPPSTGNP